MPGYAALSGGTPRNLPSVPDRRRVAYRARNDIAAPPGALLDVYPLLRFGVKIGHHVRHFDRRPGRLSPTINVFFEATFARLFFTVEAEHAMNHSDAMLEGNALKRVRDRACKIFGMFDVSFEYYPY